MMNPIGRLLLTSLLTLGAACDNPVDLGESDHLEAMEVVLRNAEGGEIARSNVIEEEWIGAPLVLATGSDTDLRVVWLDFQENEFTLDGRAPEFTLRTIVEDEAVLRSEVMDGHALIRGLTSGSTRIRFLIYHVDHPDFQSPWLDVLVVAPEGGNG